MDLFQFVDNHFVAIMVTFIGIMVTFVIAVALQDLRTRGPEVAWWEAEYAENRDGSGRRVRRTGTYYQNRDHTYYSTTEVENGFDYMFWMLTKIPKWKW